MATGAKRGKARMANGIKDMGTSKARTRQIADTARPKGQRKAATETVTGQGGSERKGKGKADTPHPSQRGGVKPDAKGRERLGARNASPRSGEKEPGKGLVKGPSRSRAGSTMGVGGRTRTGRDTASGPSTRGRARKGSRTAGR